MTRQRVPPSRRRPHREGATAAPRRQRGAGTAGRHRAGLATSGASRREPPDRIVARVLRSLEAPHDSATVRRAADPQGNAIPVVQIKDDIVAQADAWAAGGYSSNDGQGFNWNTGWQQPNNGNPRTSKADRKWIQTVLKLGGKGWSFNRQVTSKSNPDTTNDFLLSHKSDPSHPVNFNYHVTRE